MKVILDKGYYLMKVILDEGYPRWRLLPDEGYSRNSKLDINVFFIVKINKWMNERAILYFHRENKFTNILE
jgi:hypothetical protein